MSEPQESAGARVYRRIAWRLLPFLLICYVTAMVDRLNVGYAKLQFLADLHFDEATFGMAAGALYIGYILFEIPSNLMLERIGLRATLLRIMALWGVFAMAMAFAADRWSFYGLRFLIGVAEAGFFPGIIFYLTLWFPNAWRARITSLFALAVPLSGVFAAPASSWIMTHMVGVSGLRGWQWLFLIEGAPAVGLAVAAYFYLPNGPSEARFLTAEEKAALARDLSEDERRPGAAKGGFFVALRDPRVYGLGFIYFAFYSTQSILLLWVPTLLKTTGLKDLTEIGWRASAVFVVGAIGMALIGWSSDRTGERRWHLSGCGVIATAALSALPLAAQDANATMLLLMTASAAIFAYLALFWTVPTAVLGSSARAGGIAVVSSIGASGSALSPTFIGWMQVLTGSLYGAIIALALLFLVSLVALWLCSPRPVVTRREHRQALAQPAE
jgi:sugar phosphate permease